TFSIPSRQVSGWPMLDPCRACKGAWLSLSSGMLEHSGSDGEWRGRKRRTACGRAGRGEHQRTHDGAPCDLDLEGLVSGWSCVGQCRRGGAAEDGKTRPAAEESLLRRTRAPWLGCNAAEREPRLLDDALLDPQPCGCGHDGKGVGRALADLEIARMRG